MLVYDTLTHVRKGSVKVDFTWRKFEENLKLLAIRCLYVCIFFPENLAFLVEFMRRLGMFIDLEL